MKIIYIYIIFSIVLYVLSIKQSAGDRLSTSLAIAPLLLFSVLEGLYPLLALLIIVLTFYYKSKLIKNGFSVFLCLVFALLFSVEQSFIVGLFLLLLYSIFYRQLISDNGPNIIFLILVNTMLFINLSFISEEKFINPFSSFSGLNSLGQGLFIILISCYIGVFNKHKKLKEIDLLSYGLVIPILLYQDYFLTLRIYLSNNENLFILICFIICLLNFLCILKQNFVNKFGYELIFSNFIGFWYGASSGVKLEYMIGFFILNTVINEWDSARNYLYLILLSLLAYNFSTVNIKSIEVCLIAMLVYRIILFPICYKRGSLNAPV